MDANTAKAAERMVDRLIDRSLQGQGLINRNILEAERDRMKQDPTIMQDALNQTLTDCGLKLVPI